ncbi:hypothetical protein [Priestia megaterium]|uniref:hypothetical protein n=1 Tax=Priestia megaterium TaxID=1404 RepID=UPI00048CCD1A|nr:hypothetical protein [Priestia megaterium]TJZ36533.1 hypothetical protein FA002_11995 [Priestia megaterium]
MAKEKKKDLGKKLIALLVIVVSLIVIVSSCSSSDDSSKDSAKDENKTESKDKAATNDEKQAIKETSANGGFTAEEAYAILKDSGLVDTEATDVTEKFTGSPGLVKALRTDEVDIEEFETEAQAKKYHEPDLNSYAVKNIFILIKKGADNADNFIKVLEDRKASTDLETKYSSPAQETYVNNLESKGDFLTYADGLYNLSNDERSSTYDSYVVDKEVTWEGTLIDTLSDSVIVYAGTQPYNGGDWATLSSENKDLLPYVFIAELTDKKQLASIKKGDKIKVTGEVGSRGDKQAQMNWKLYKSEIIK